MSPQGDGILSALVPGGRQLSSQRECFFLSVSLFTLWLVRCHDASQIQRAQTQAARVLAFPMAAMHLATNACFGYRSWQQATVGDLKRRRSPLSSRMVTGERQHSVNLSFISCRKASKNGESQPPGSMCSVDGLDLMQTPRQLAGCSTVICEEKV